MAETALAVVGAAAAQDGEQARTIIVNVKERRRGTLTCTRRSPACRRALCCLALLSGTAALLWHYWLAPPPPGPWAWRAPGFGPANYTAVSMLCRPSTTGYWKALVPHPAAASPAACRARCDAEARCDAYEYERVDFEVGERECELHDAASYDAAASRATGACRETDTTNGWRCCRAKDKTAAAAAWAAGAGEYPQYEVLLMRHGTAPGGGDPAGFALGDCATQRNLDAAGRAQAAAVGRWLGARRAAFNVSLPILSSQWCRCAETARALGAALPPRARPPGAAAAAAAATVVVQEEWGLNSFYQPGLGGFTKERCLARLRARFEQLVAPGAVRRGERALLVTHSVTVRALTGLGVSQGSVVAFNLATGEAKVLVDASDL